MQQNGKRKILEILDIYYHRNRDFRGNPAKQRRAFAKVISQLRTIYRQQPNRFITWFWEFYFDWFQKSQAQRDINRRHGDLLLWAIFEEGDSMAVEVAKEIMIHSENLYKEEASTFLGSAGEPTAVTYLLEGLKSDDYNIASKSAAALGFIGDPGAEPFLLELVDRYNTEEVYREDRIDDTLPGIRASAFDALCLLNTEGTKRRVMQALVGDRDPYISMRAVRYVAYEMGGNPIPMLEDLQNNDDQYIADEAQRCLRELRSSG